MAIVRGSDNMRFAPGFLSNRVVTPGSQTFLTAGTYTFTWPDADTVVVELWGAGGGGSGYGVSGTTFYASAGYDGENSSFNSSVIAYGGKHGGGQSAGTVQTATSITLTGGASVSGTGGDFSIASTAGQTNGVRNSDGGDGANAPGTGGVKTSNTGAGVNGSQPGGGGSSASYNGNCAGSASGGGYTQKTYSGSAFAIGASVSLVVGAGGAGGPLTPGTSYIGGAGGPGKVYISWS